MLPVADIGSVIASGVMYPVISLGIIVLFSPVVAVDVYESFSDNV